MIFEKEKYKKRLIDNTLSDYLQVIGAVSLEGPKWCGKTWTALNRANSVILLDDEKSHDRTILDINYALDGDYPRLIDEWQLIPEIWDKVRRRVDEDSKKGKYILTGSTKLPSKMQKEKVFHSGTGRIAKLYMHPMTLYEMGYSTGVASLQKMYDGTQENVKTNEYSIDDICYMILRGGWPGNMESPNEKCHIIPKTYIESVLSDIENNDNNEKKRNPIKMRMLINSLARNETTMATDKKLLNDIFEYENETERISTRDTLIDYMGVLERLHIIENQPSYSVNYVSSNRVSGSVKRHFTDPSLACAALNLTKDKLQDDLFTLGFMFEAMVERDLRVYIYSLGGNLYHFRDSVTGLEVDAILEFADGEYAAIEIKLGDSKQVIDEATNNLNRYYNLTKKKPKFMAIITGKGDYVVKNPNNNIYILPITALKP